MGESCFDIRVKERLDGFTEVDPPAAEEDGDGDSR